MPTNLPAPARRLAAVLQSAGWEPRNLDIDLVEGRLGVELHRADGRWVWLHADAHGRVHLERWHRTTTIGTRATDVGRIAQSTQLSDDFIGRVRCEGLRSGLRRLCAYVADNPAPGFPALPAPAIRAALAPLLNPPRLLAESPDAR